MRRALTVAAVRRALTVAAVRRALTVAAVVGFESYLYWQYAAHGAQFHYFIHGFTGVAAGVAVLVLVRGGRVSTRGPAFDVVLAAAAGRLLSAMPDVLFLAADLPHERWMDVFVAHISVHFVPAPVAATFTVFVLAVAGATAAALGRRLAGLTTAGAAVVLLVVGLAARAPIPRTLEEVRERPGIALRCPLLASAAIPPSLRRPSSNV